MNNNRLLLMTTLLVFAFFAPAITAQPAADPTRSCANLIFEYTWLLDHPELDPDGSKFADLFTDDAVIDVPAGKFDTREKIVNRMIRVKNSSRRVIHLINNFRMEQVSENRAKSRAYVTVYNFPSTEGIPSVSGFRGIAEYHNEYRITQEGCKISRHYGVGRLMDAGYRDGAVAE